MTEPAVAFDRETSAAGAAPAPAVKVLGFSPWKRSIVQDFLPGQRLAFVDRVDAVAPGETVAVWAGSPLRPEIERRAADPHEDIRLLRIEDGFLRSVGLGAQLTRPLSWVVDSRGIYYDATRPSDLEHLLQTAAFDPALLDRAARLRERLVAADVSKYNVGSTRWAGLSAARPAGRRVVLVAGQVESDASLHAGSPRVRSNLALLQAVRRIHPDDWLVYKPHPDVVAGLRRPGSDEAQASALCDEIVVDAPIGRLLDAVTDVHVMTSLTGFEALLRGRTVHCHGLPFYAGWGLTRDALPIARRTRRPGLDGLVAATLILYPRYASRRDGRPLQAEQALDELIAWKRVDSGALRWWHRLLRPLLRHD